MKTRKIFAGLAVATIGTLGALALVTPAQADPMAAPTVSWESKCDANGSFVATFSAPQATNTDKVTIKVYNAGTTVGTLVLPSNGEKTGKITKVSPGALVAKWSNGTTANESLIPGGSFTWALPDKCKPVLTVVKPTCKDPYLSVAVSNPVGAKPIQLNIKDSGGGVASGQLSGGDNDGLLRTTYNVTYSWSGAVVDTQAPVTVEYAPPTNCGADEPGAKAMPPTTGKRHHGKGHYQHPAPVANAANNAGGENQGGGESSTAAAGGQSDDSLPVTGSPVRTVLLAGAVMMVLGVVALFVAHRRRAIRFTSAG